MANRINELCQDLTTFKYILIDQRSKQKTAPTEVETALRALGKISSRMETMIGSLEAVEQDSELKLAETDRLQHEVRSAKHEATLKDEYIQKLENEFESLSKIRVNLGEELEKKQNKDALLSKQADEDKASLEEAIQKAEKAELELSNAQVQIKSLEDEISKQREIIKIIGDKKGDENEKEDDENDDGKDGILSELKTLQRTLTIFSGRDDSRNKELVAKQQQINTQQTEIDSLKREISSLTSQVEELKELNKTTANRLQEVQTAASNQNQTTRQSFQPRGAARESVFGSSKDANIRMSTYNRNITINFSQRLSAWTICKHSFRQL